MTLRDFQFGSFEQKCDVVTTQSNYLLTRILGNCKVYLYHTELFFVEVYYSPEHKKVMMIHAFNDVGGLHPYLDEISIDELKNLAH